MSVSGEELKRLVQEHCNCFFVNGFSGENFDFLQEDIQPVLQKNFSKICEQKSPFSWLDYIPEGYRVIRDGELRVAQSFGESWKGSYPVYIPKIGEVGVLEFHDFSKVNRGGNHLGFLIFEETIGGRHYSVSSLFTSLQNALNKSAIVTITNYTGQILYANNLFCEFSGYPLEELLGKTHSIINSGYHPKAFFVDLWKTILGGGVWRGEICNRKKSGELYWVDTTISPIYNSEGGVERFLSVRFDITEKKKQEEELKNSVKFNQSILSTMTSRIAVLNPQGVILFTNSAWDSLLIIHDGEELRCPKVGEDYLECVGEKCFSGFLPNELLVGLKKVMAHEEPWFETEYMIVDKGITNWYNFTASLLDDGSNRVLIKHNDTTRRKVTENELAKSRRKYLDLLDNIQDAICTDNKKGVITFANKKFLEYFSVSRSQIGKISVMDIVREDYRNYVKEIYSRCIEGVSIPEYIEFPATSFGEERWFECRTRGLQEDGEVTGTQSIIRDITERKKLFEEIESKEHLLRLKIEELQAKNEELLQFSYIISHHLRSPLANVIGLSRLLDSVEERSEKSRDITKLIATSSEQLDEVVKDLTKILSLNISPELLKDQVDPFSAIEKVAGEIGVRKEELSVRDERVKKACIRTNEAYFLSIIQNVLSNSFKFRSEIRPLKVSAVLKDRPEESSWEVLIEDNGIGLDTNKYRQDIFGMYKRFHPSVSQGKGLGLYITKKQVELLGGSVEITGIPDLGTNVKLTFREYESE